MDLSGSTALITGASRGLGLEIARIFAARGARLVIAARGSEALGAAGRELSDVADVLAIPTDVSDLQQAQRLVEGAMERFGRIDVLVNNASALGPSPMPRLEDYPAATLTEVFNTNVVAPLRLAQLVLPHMRERGAGVIVNVSSDAGVNAYPGWGGYGATKAALEHLSRTLAAELEGSGVCVYVVDPGDMNTQMHAEAEPGVDISHLPGPAVSAPAVLWLVERETRPFARIEAQSLALVVA